MLRVGLTGGIACGKSEVLRRLAAAGLETLDLDRVAHDVMEPGRPAHRDVVGAFGPEILAADGTIDRRALGAVVFRDAAARERLNALVHPRVREEDARRARALSSRPGSVLVTDAALLVESGMHLRFDRLVVVYCRPDQQVARLRERDGLSEEEARARVAAQMPIDWKRRFAHLTLDTTMDLARTHAGADALARLLLDLARSTPPLLRLSRRRARAALVHGPSRGPRGSSPALLAHHLVEAGGLDLPRLARALDPPKESVWYEPAPGDALHVASPPGGAEAAALCAPLVLFELARHGHDPERIGAAAHSLAWLLDPDPGHVSDCVLLALILAEVAVLGHLPGDLERRASTLRTIAERWGGVAPGALVSAVLAAGLRHPRDAQAARSAGAASGIEPGLPGALVGIASDEGEEAPGPWDPFLDALEATPA